MIIKDIKLSYNDVAIVPSVQTKIEHRSDCNPFYENGKLPIFTAPMSTVVDKVNFDLFEQNHINAIYPRNILLADRLEFSRNGKWCAYSLGEFEQYFLHKKYFENCNDIKALIDVANGHMEVLYDLVKRSKNIFKNRISIMIGNIANPKSYEAVYECGADYVRLGIGGGSGCITSSNTGVHFPMASLIEETYNVKKNICEYEGVPMEKLPKIIADGGIRNFCDVNKALALGADYVMIGGILASCLESAGDTFYYDRMKDIVSIDQYHNWNIKHGEIFCGDAPFSFALYKKFYGMASRKGQIDISGSSKKTAEGIEKILEVKYSLPSWVDNMISYLTSAMSYADIKDIKDFNPETVTLIRLSTSSYSAINK